MNVAVIPARGGSKRIPRKNLKPFAGKPIIAYSIDAAVKSGVFSRVIVSTDDREIGDVAQRYGADVPFMRPPHLSDDHTGTHDVMSHALHWLTEQGASVDNGCCIYATAPFVQVADIQRGLEVLETGKWQTVLAATRFAYPVFRGFERTSDGGLRMLFPEHFRSRSQDLAATFHDAGQFYWASADTWRKPPQGINEQSTIIELPSWRVQDIDTLDDWRRAEMIWSALA